MSIPRAQSVSDFLVPLSGGSEESILYQLHALQQQLELLREDSTNVSLLQRNRRIFIASITSPVRYSYTEDITTSSWSLIPTENSIVSAICSLLSKDDNKNTSTGFFPSLSSNIDTSNPSINTPTMTTSSTTEKSSVQWFTTLGTMKSIKDTTQLAVREKLISEYQAVPIFINDTVMDNFRNDYCVPILWSILHSLPIRKLSHLERNIFGYEAYVNVNNAFADTMANLITNENDTIIVHDYHLFLLPRLLRSRLQSKEINVTIILVLETPFPAAEIFRCLPQRNELLLGILGADIIVVQDFAFARHLCNAATQILGIEANPQKIIHYENNRPISLSVLPLGIELSKYTYTKDIDNEYHHLLDAIHYKNPSISPPDTGKLSQTCTEDTLTKTMDAHYRSLTTTLRDNGNANLIISSSTVSLVPKVARVRSQSNILPTGEGTVQDMSTSNFSPSSEIFPSPNLPNYHVIFSIDTLDPIGSSIPLKLLAFDDLLELHPEWRNCLIYICIVTNDNNTMYDLQNTSSSSSYSSIEELNYKISELSGRINGKFGTSTFTPLRLLRTNVSNVQLRALSALADVGLFTSLRDGCTYPALEFIASQKSSLTIPLKDTDAAVPVSVASSTENSLTLGNRGPGVLLYSAFSGCHSGLSGAIIVNPYDTVTVAEAMHTALKLNPENRQLRYDQLCTWIQYNSPDTWMRRLLSLIKLSEKSSQEYRILSRLDPAHVKSAYMNISPVSSTTTVPIFPQRLFIFSYNGTLVPYQSMIELLAPSVQLRLALVRLLIDPRNVIYLITGDIPIDILHAWFGDLPIGLVIEHGLYYRHPPFGYISQIAQSLLPELEQQYSLEQEQSKLKSIIEPLSVPSSVDISFTVPNTNTNKQPNLLVGPLQRHLHFLQSLTKYETMKTNLPISLPSTDNSAILYIHHRSMGTIFQRTKNEPVQFIPPLPKDWLRMNDNMTTLPLPDIHNQVLNASEYSMSSTSSVSSTVSTDNDFDISWYNEVKEIMRYFTERTPGSNLYEGEITLLWSYALTDKEFGDCQAKDLLLHLETMLFTAEAEVILSRTKRFLLVRPFGLSKGVFLSRLLTSYYEIIDHYLSKSNVAITGGDGTMTNPSDTDNKKELSTDRSVGMPSNLEFLFVIGDERTEEDMFPHTRNIPSLRGFSVTVGRKPTQAQYFIDSTNQVIALLEELTIPNK